MPKNSEKKLYPVVERWLKRHLLCFKTDTNTGLRQYSLADVVGIRDIGGDLSGDVETVIVEVKRGLDPFARASGQTLSYNVYANRVYLADIREKTFTPDELQIASHLGIGLIQIRNGRCAEVLSSPFYHPINRMNLLLLERLSLGRCQLCDCFFETGSPEKGYSKLVREDVLKAIQNGKGLVFWKEELAERKNRKGIRPTEDGTVFDRRFICPSCVETLLAIQEKRFKGWVRDIKGGD
jgi:hypothetical protein